MFCSVMLFGPKHSGKTSSGKVLASLLSCGFIDLDEFITQRSGKTPRTLYTEGPAIFKKAEANALADLLESETAQPVPGLVIASGGGLIDNSDALGFLKKKSGIISVFLDVSAQTAWERISRAGELPPFLKTETPRETHRSLHNRRAGAYRQLASIIIKADNKTPDKIAGEIFANLSKGEYVITQDALCDITGC